MKKSYYVYVGPLLALLLAMGGGEVFAQTLPSMPPLYDASGNQVNQTSNPPLAPGNYYLGGSASQGGHLVNYVGNGAYYDPTTGTYGGAAGDPSGMAGIVSSYNSSIAQTALTASSSPNTGVGGVAAYNWSILLITGIAFATSAAYIVTRSDDVV